MAEVDDEVELYAQWKEAVVQAVKRNGSQFFADKPAHGFTGLLNQGATCYLNSLLQSLYHTAEFRERLFAWEYHPEWDGPPDRCIPLQLQRLFARMQGSAQVALSTKALTASFGWDATESFKQHDVQELFHVLFDALERAARLRESRRNTSDPEPEEGEKTEEHLEAGEKNSEIEPSAATSPAEEPAPAVDVPSAEGLAMRDVFQGTMEDFVQCRHPACGYRRSNEVAFVDLELGVGEAAGVHTVEQSLRQLVTPELLTGSNRWHCDQCGVKRDADKGQRLRSLPDVLILHLKRFVFDLQAMRRVKLHDPFRFPERLPMAPFLDSSPQEEGEKEGGEGEGDEEFELYSVMVHVGSAAGGHYFAYIQPAETRATEGVADEWFEFNDAHVRPLEGDGWDAFSRTLDTEGGAWRPKEETEEATSVADAATEVEEKEKGEEVDVKEKKEEEEGTEKPVPPAAPQPQSGRAMGVEGNAYLLMYRRVRPQREQDSELRSALPPASVQEEVEHENATFNKLKRAFEIRQRMVELTVFGPRPMDEAGAPPSVPAPQTTGEDAPRTGDGELPRVVLDLPQDTTLGEATRRVIDAMLDKHPESAAALRSVPPEHLRLRKFVPVTKRPTETFGMGSTSGAADEGSASEERDHSLKQLGLSPSATLVLETKQPQQEWQEYNPHEMVLRVVLYDPLRDPAVEAGPGEGGEGGEGEGGEGEEEEEEGEEVEVVRSASPEEGQGEEEKVRQPTGQFTLQDSLRAMSSVVVKVEGDAHALVGALQDEVEAVLRIPSDRQRLWFMDGDDLRQLTDPLAELKENYDVWSGADVIVEVRPVRADGEPDWDALSPFRSRWEEERNTITIFVNAPDMPKTKDDDKPEKAGAEEQGDEEGGDEGAAAEAVEEASAAVYAPEYSVPIVCKKTESLAAVKERIAALLGLETDEFHFRRNIRAPMIKQESVLIGAGWSPSSRRGRLMGGKADGLDLVDESVLHLARGPPLRPDQHMLRVFLFDPTAKTKFVLLGDLPAAESDTVESFKRVLRDIIPREGVETRPPISRIRLRQKKGKEAGRVFPDRLKLRQAIPRMADGSEVAVQKLAEPEHVGRDDMIVTLRQWHPESQRLSSPLEVVVSKRATVRELRSLLASKFRLTQPEEQAERSPLREGSQPREGAAGGGGVQNEEGRGAEEGNATETESPPAVGIAKHTQHAIPLRGSTAERLAWNPTGLEEDSFVTEMPLGLRDGVTVVCRDEQQYLQWVEAGRPGAGGKSRGGGRPGGRGRGKPWERRAGGAASRGIRETGVRIQAGDDGGEGDNAPLGEPWACSVCTFINEPARGRKVCSICGSLNN